LDGGSAGGRSSRLFPGSVPAGGGAPFGDRSPASRRDRPAAPTTGCRSCPAFGPVPVRSGPVRAGVRIRLLGLLTPLPLSLPPSGSVFGATACTHAVKAPDDSPETCHHESAHPRCIRCVGS
jgi:hypothetical protein